MEIKAKIWLEKQGEVIAGDGKVRLLKLVERHGSIQKAAQENGMSYRHAWGAIRKMEMRSGMKLVETRAGGKAGGGASLTEPAKDFVARYGHFSEGLAEIIQKKFQEAFGEENAPRERKKLRANR
ncbi:MAG: putative transcriptional regulator, ModE family [Deltaproteobacteria bacterium]|jgi:molybdate transport system regulatory protein|nr:putative transcriptional regulator, ModE family [Deltaproteobacteria bacterium]